MGDLKMSLGQVNIPDYLIINLREVGAPTIVVDSQVIPPPVPVSQNLTFVGLNNVTHYVDLRRSSDGTTLGLLLGTWIVNITETTSAVETRFYKVDGVGAYDPISGTNTITDPYLAGKAVLGVFKEGFRFMVPNLEFTHVSDTVSVFRNDPPINDSFSTGEWVMILINKMVALPSSGSSSTGGFPADIVEITADLTLDNSHFNKMMEANSGAQVLTATMPPFNTIPDKTRFGFNTHNADYASGQRYLRIVIDPSAVNYALHRGKNKAVIFLGKGESIVLIKKGSYMRVLDESGDSNRVGQLVYDDMPPLNSIPEVGGWFDFDEYGRLYYDYVSELNPAQLGSGTYPTTPIVLERFKWIIDGVNKKFWVPDSGGMFIRNTDPNADIDVDRAGGLSGSLQTAQVGQFDLALTKGRGFINADPAAGDINKFAYGSANPAVRSLIMNQGKDNRPINIARNVYRII